MLAIWLAKFDLCQSIHIIPFFEQSQNLRQLRIIPSLGMKCTSTFVEKSRGVQIKPCTRKSHLHLRGAKSDIVYSLISSFRVTSTCVEKKSVPNNLQLRGEKCISRMTLRPSRESPPLTWRKVTFFIWNHHFAGATSTSVEKKVSQIIDNSRDSQCHLHMCGVKHVKENSSSPVTESPPFTWRKVICRCPRQGAIRATSTFVEKSKIAVPYQTENQSHLHLRGVQTKRDKQSLISTYIL